MAKHYIPTPLLKVSKAKKRRTTFLRPRKAQGYEKPIARTKEGSKRFSMEIRLSQIQNYSPELKAAIRLKYPMDTEGL